LVRILTVLVRPERLLDEVHDQTTPANGTPPYFSIDYRNAWISVKVSNDHVRMIFLDEPHGLVFVRDLEVCRGGEINERSRHTFHAIRHDKAQLWRVQRARLSMELGFASIFS